MEDKFNGHFRLPDYTEAELILDFKKYLIYTWWYLRLPPPTEMQLYIAQLLEEGHSRLAVQAFRGIGKTWILGAFLSWRLLRNPNERIVVVSQSAGHASNIGMFVRRLIDLLPILKPLTPRTDQKDNATEFEVNGCNLAVQPSLRALGIGSQLQGNRATLLLADDVEGQVNSATEELRAKLKAHCDEFGMILQTDDDSQIVYLGTPQSSDSIYTDLPSKGYVVRIFPARYPADIEMYDGCLAPYIVKRMLDDPSIIGNPVDSRFDEAELSQRELEVGYSVAKLQYMLDTSMSDRERYPLRLKDLTILPLDMDVVPATVIHSNDHSDKLSIANIGFNGDGFYSGKVIYERGVIPYTSTIMAIDPSGRGKDKTSYCILSYINGKLFLREFGGLDGGYEEAVLEKLSQEALKFNVEKIIVEDNFGDGMFTALFKPILYLYHSCRVEAIKSTTQKEKRIIDTLEPVLNQHRLIVSTHLVERDINYALSSPTNLKYSLFHQLTRITRDRGSLVHDDSIDVLAMGVANFIKVMVVNPEEALELYKKKELENSIENFIRSKKQANRGTRIAPRFNRKI